MRGSRIARDRRGPGYLGTIESPDGGLRDSYQPPLVPGAIALGQAVEAAWAAYDAGIAPALAAVKAAEAAGDTTAAESAAEVLAAAAARLAAVRDAAIAACGR